jgi:ubiquinone/menaquinone biosynthesis C-methylase UbiE
MSAMSERYDRAADRYGTWWAPVLQAAALRVLDRAVEAWQQDEPPGERSLAILDVGTGTGTLALGTVRRWPGAVVTGLDASRGMIRAAERRARDDLAPRDAARTSFVVAEADRLPFDDRSFDLVISSFVLQLVPDRLAVLREAHRVLRPGGLVAFVTWMVTAEAKFRPDEAFFDVLDELNVPDDDAAEEACSGDFVSASAAAGQLRRAGFRDVNARVEWLEYAFEPARYPDFLEEYGEYELFRSLPWALRRRVRRMARQRLATLPEADFRWRAPIVMAVARRPGAEPRSGSG